MVTFKSSAFNTSEPRDDFINPGCFGDDLARWLIDELQKRGVETIGEPEQEDFGWYITFRVGGIDHDLTIGFRPDDPDTEGVWMVQLERKRGFLASLLGGRHRGIQHAAADAIHKVLSEASCIRDLRWHFPSDFNKGVEETGSLEP